MGRLISSIPCKYLFSITKRYDKDISKMIPPFIPDIPVSTPLTITIDMQISYFSDVECRYDILLILKLLTCRDRLNTFS